MLTWAQITPIKALSFFSRKYPNHPIPVQFAIRNLLHYKPDVIMQYIPQLVQAVRHDTVSTLAIVSNSLNRLLLQMGFITEFIKTIAKSSQLLGHQFIWNIKTNMFKDEDSQVKDSES